MNFTLFFTNSISVPVKDKQLQIHDKHRSSFIDTTTFLLFVFDERSFIQYIVNKHFYNSLRKISTLLHIRHRILTNEKCFYAICFSYPLKSNVTFVLPNVFLTLTKIEKRLIICITHIGFVHLFTRSQLLENTLASLYLEQKRHFRLSERNRNVPLVVMPLKKSIVIMLLTVPPSNGQENKFIAISVHSSVVSNAKILD